MNEVVAGERVSGGRMSIPRSRGAASGFLVVLLGLWGALVPFVGPAFDFAYNSDQGAAWSATRGWLEVLPGVVAIIGGFLLVRSRNRATAMLGGWLSVIAGAWFVVGRVAATTLTIGEIGPPVANTDTKAAWLELTYFYGLGAVIVFLGAMALGRLSVRSVRDVTHAQRAADRNAELAAQSGDVDHRGGVYEEPATGPVSSHNGHQVVSADGTARPRRKWRNPLSKRDETPTSASR